MELASMLAGEPFSDRPRSVSPVIAAFLRTYNDLLDEERRQDLYPWAAHVVGTRGSAEIERRRAAMCLEHARRLRPRWLPSWLPRSVGRDPGAWSEIAACAGRLSARHRDGAWHRASLSLVERMVALGRPAPRAAAEPRGAPLVTPRAAAGSRG